MMESPRFMVSLALVGLVEFFALENDFCMQPKRFSRSLVLSNKLDFYNMRRITSRCAFSTSSLSCSLMSLNSEFLSARRLSSTALSSCSLSPWVYSLVFKVLMSSSFSKISLSLRWQLLHYFSLVFCALMRLKFGTESRLGFFFCVNWLISWMRFKICLFSWSSFWLHQPSNWERDALAWVRKEVEVRSCLMGSLDSWFYRLVTVKLRLISYFLFSGDPSSSWKSSQIFFLKLDGCLLVEQITE